MQLDMLISVVIEFTALFIAFFYILQVRYSWIRVGIFIGAVAIPASLILLLWNQLAGIIYMIFGSIILFYILTKTWRVLLDISVIIIIGIFADSASTYLSALVQNEVRAYSLLDRCLFLLIFATLVYLYGYFNKTFRGTLQLPIVVKSLILLIVLVTMVVFYLNILIPSVDGELRFVQLNVFVQLSYFVLMLLFFSLILMNMKKQNAIKRKEIEYEQFTNYMEALEQVNRDMKKFRHDYVNILLTMRIYLDKGDLEGLNAFFHENIMKVEKQTMLKNRAFSEFENLEIIGIKGLLATKYLLAEEMNIPIHIEISAPITTIAMDIIDLTRVIGILIDNAIEASTGLKKPKINISFIQKDKVVIIVIENKIEQLSSDISQLFMENYSTKGDGRGIGLSTVAGILRQYPNTSLITASERGWFIHELEIIRE